MFLKPIPDGKYAVIFCLPYKLRKKTDSSVLVSVISSQTTQHNMLILLFYEHLESVYQERISDQSNIWALQFHFSKAVSNIEKPTLSMLKNQNKDNNRIILTIPLLYFTFVYIMWVVCMGTMLCLIVSCMASFWTGSYSSEV